MTPRFADTFYYLALLHEEDASHERALALSESVVGPTLTTPWVLTEVADALAAPAQRPSFLRLLAALRADSACTVVPASQELFELGLDLYARRHDKEWSLTDCISFVVMRQHGVAEALTGDHHFEQAGFRILLR